MKYIEMPNLRLTSAYNQYQIDKNKFNVNDTGHLWLIVKNHQSSDLVCLYMQNKTKLRKFELNWSLKLRVNIMGKTHCHSCVLSDAWFRDLSESNSEFSKPNLWKLLLSRNLRYFKGIRFSQCFTMFYTINTSPLLVSTFLY